MLDIFSHNILAFAGISFFIGLFIGSFLNVVIHRLPIMMERQWANECAEYLGQELPHQDSYNLFLPASHCPNCNNKVGILGNIPLLSFLFQKGACRFCYKKISWRYPLIELITGILLCCTAWIYGSNLIVAGGLMFLTACLLALAFIDAKTQLLPDAITLPLIWAGLLFNLNAAFVSLNESLLGAVVGYLILWAIFWAFKLITGKEGMGYGDFKLLSAIGAWFGLGSLPIIILFSSSVGAIYGIFNIIFLNKDRQIPMPFGPFLVMAAILYLLTWPMVAPYLEIFLI